MRTGFHFLLQGDFLLTANREEVLADSSWNVWLREELADTVLEAIRAGCKNRAFALSFLKTVPLPSDVQHRFFAPVAEEVLSRLPEERVFPTTSGALRTASEVVDAPRTVRHLFPKPGGAAYR